MSTIIRFFFVLSCAALCSSLRGAEPSPPAISSGSPAPAAAAASEIRALVEAERSFARTASEKNVRDAFVEFLAPDAIMFDPGPTNGRALWQKRKPNKNQLLWEPTFAAISAGGDLGYTSGPSTFKPENTSERYPGQFFSIWKKTEKGAWRVALDIGVETPPPPGEPPTLQVLESSDNAAAHSSDKAARREAMLKAEQRLVEASKTDASAALLAVATDDLLVLREGVLPASTKAAASIMLSADRNRLNNVSQVGTGLSLSTDLGYVYGTYVTDRIAGREEGSYVRVWRHNPDGAWRLAVDVRRKNPAQGATKPPPKITPAETPSLSG